MADVFQVFVPRVIDAEALNDAPEELESAKAAVEHRTWQLPEISVLASPVSNVAARPDRIEADAPEHTRQADTFEVERKLAHDQGFQQGLKDG